MWCVKMAPRVHVRYVVLNDTWENESVRMNIKHDACIRCICAKGMHRSLVCRTLLVSSGYEYVKLQVGAHYCEGVAEITFSDVEHFDNIDDEWHKVFAGKKTPSASQVLWDVLKLDHNKEYKRGSKEYSNFMKLMDKCYWKLGGCGESNPVTSATVKGDPSRDAIGFNNNIVIFLGVVKEDLENVIQCLDKAGENVTVFHIPITDTISSPKTANPRSKEAYMSFADDLRAYLGPNVC